jgi:hypothetical protein
MTAGRAVLVGLMHRYLGGLLDPFVSLLEVHKLMYFMQSAGEPLKLEFQKGPYGPYAWNKRKQKFTPRHIGIAYKRLAEQGCAGWAIGYGR